MGTDELASKIIDLTSELDFARDYSLDIHEGIVLEARIELGRGFVDIYRNFETGKTAFAWIVDEKRIYGADNTGGWHIHPMENPGKHVDSDEIGLERFLEKIGGEF